MINWVLQKNLTKPVFIKRIKAALDDESVNWEEVEVIPFSKEIPEIKNKSSFNVIYGSTTFMLNAYESEELNSGVFYDPIKFNMQNYVSKWNGHMLNASGQLVQFGKLKDLKSHPEKEWFIRPNDDGKGFSGKVEALYELVNWSEEVCKLKLPDFNEKTEVWISEPMQIEKEWRLFIVDDEVVSSSRYMNMGNLDENSNDIPQAMVRFANDRINEYRLADVYVMDIAQVGDEFKLIECNCFNGTGFYEHDIEKIIKSINHWVRKQM